MLPKCDSVTQQVIHPCREMCWDFLKSYWNKFQNQFSRMGPEFRYNYRVYVNVLSSANLSHVFHCDYLPSLHSSIHCFYKPVTCGSPPHVTNGTRILNTTQKDAYQLNDVVKYRCVNETFEMTGNSNIKCLHSGEWSNPPPTCNYKNKLHPFVVVLPVLLIPLVVLLMIMMIKIKSKTRHVLTRTKEFDAFVCYKFDTDNDYVVSVIMKSLEEMCEPPLKLCVHERDFLPGLYIEDNIKGAITKSNSAIIVMSQAFIDSDWCQEEFVHCYLEHMKDPAFKIFIIMMQPVDCLENLSESMQNFINTRTYLSKYDPKLFLKIVSYLHWVKLPKDKKTREPPNFKVGESLLKQDITDNQTDSEIEMEFVPSDPFLSVDNADEDRKNDELNDERQHEDYTGDLTTNLQIEVEVHHSGW